MDVELLHPRDQIAMVMERIYACGMTTTSGGNLSILDGEGNLWITPAGRDKGALRPDDAVRIGPGGRAAGVHQPSSELPFHQAIYAARPDVRAILHAHPPSLVAFSILRTIPDTRVIPKARAVCGEVGLAPYGTPGTAELGAKIAAAFGRGHDTVLLENHGIVAAGTSLFAAFQRFETLDFCARLLLKAHILGTPRLLDEGQLALSEQTDHLLPEYDPAGRSNREREVRAQMRALVQRAYDQRLVTSTEGTFSCRTGADSFVITPYGQDRKYLRASDLICIAGGKRERGRAPSRSVRLHEQIYAEHAGIHAVIIAHPPNVMAFGVSGVPFDSRIMPESYLILRDVPAVPYGPQFNDVRRLSAYLSEETPLLMVENDCLITTGRDLLQAFDRLEVAEFAARAIIAARPAGTLVPIPPEELARLAPPPAAL